MALIFLVLIIILVNAQAKADEKCSTASSNVYWVLYAYERENGDSPVARWVAYEKLMRATKPTWFLPMRGFTENFKEAVDAWSPLYKKE